MKQHILNNLKNIYGWKTKRRLVVIAVDDYGNIRLNSRKDLEAMKAKGLKPRSRFDEYDTLESREDLEQLIDVLRSVKDKNGNYAVFSPLALPVNIDFESLKGNNFEHYVYELLPETYRKQEALQPDAYAGAWELWQEAIEHGLLQPQFHGREHLNLKVLQEKLGANDKEVMTAFAHRSYSNLSNSGYSTINYTAAFDFDDFGENQSFSSIISDGLDQFEKVFGYRATCFNAPGGREHPIVHSWLADHGIKYIETPLIKKEHQGNGKYKTVVNYTGKKNPLGQRFLVRNVVFEPTDMRGFEWVNYSFRQIEAAFRWNKPAIISSHRVNFSGHIEPKNRERGLTALQQLLARVVNRWPDVEFMSLACLGDLITESGV